MMNFAVVVLTMQFNTIDGHQVRESSIIYECCVKIDEFRI